MGPGPKIKHDNCNTTTRVIEKQNPAASGALDQIDHPQIDLYDDCRGRFYLNRYTAHSNTFFINWIIAYLKHRQNNAKTPCYHQVTKTNSSLSLKSSRRKTCLIFLIKPISKFTSKFNSIATAYQSNKEAKRNHTLST